VNADRAPITLARLIAFEAAGGTSTALNLV
jgi:hypothetical protein